jgi:hypothetical protein
MNSIGPVKVDIDNKAQLIVRCTARAVKLLDRGTPDEIAHNLGMWWTSEAFDDFEHPLTPDERTAVVYGAAVLTERLALCTLKRRQAIVTALRALLAPERDYWEPEAIEKGYAQEVIEAIICGLKLEELHVEEPVTA